MYSFDDTTAVGAPEHRNEPRIFLIALLAVLVGFYALGQFLLTNYYASSIPHYDSVGGYTIGFETLNISRSQGYWAGILHALQYRLSIAQSFFAAIFSPILSKTPASFHLYNTICVAVALLGMFAFGRGARMTAFGAACLALVFFLPDGLYWWSLGLFDYRRDPGFLGLLTGSYFLILTYLTGDWTRMKRRWLGFASGMAMGLALLSRDSAPPYLLGVVAIPAFVIWLTAKKSLPLQDWLRVPVGPLCAFTPFALAYGLASPAMMRRMGDQLTMFGIGGSRWDSFLGNMSSTAKLIVGYPAFSQSLTKPPPVATGLPYYVMTVVIVLVLLIAVGALWRTGKIQAPTKDTAGLGLTSAAKTSILAGFWIILFVHLFLSFIVSWRPNQPLIVTIAPYYSSLIGVYSIIAGLSLMAKFRGGWEWRGGLFLTFCMFVFLSMYLRAETRKPLYPEWSLPMHRAIASLRNRTGRPPTIAELWHDDVRVPAVIYLAVQKGVAPPKRAFFRFDGHTYDFYIAAPQGEKDRARLRRSMDHAARCEADFIIATTNLSAYARKSSLIFLYGSGRKFIAKILSDLNSRIIHVFAKETRYPIAILDNRDRIACGEPRGLIK